MNIKRRLAIPPLAFAPPQSAGHPLEIAQFQAWRLKEPVSGRRYTVVELQSRSGETGYGEGGPVPAAEIVEARAAIQGRRATESEFVRARWPAYLRMEAAVGNAMLDLLAKSRNVPIYQFLGGPDRFKARLLARLEGTDEASVGGAARTRQTAGLPAFTIAALQRDAMIPLAGIRRSRKGPGGENAEFGRGRRRMGARRRGRHDTRRCRNGRHGSRESPS